MRHLIMNNDRAGIRAALETPLLWAVHGYLFAGDKNRRNQVECARLLLKAGADKSIPNIEGVPAVGFLEEDDIAMRKLLL